MLLLEKFSPMMYFVPLKQRLCVPLLILYFEIANLNIEFFSGSLKLSQKRMESLQFETAKQRYFNLLKVQPEILNKISSLNSFHISLFNSILSSHKACLEIFLI